MRRGCRGMAEVRGTQRLSCFGLGYSARVLAFRLVAEGWEVRGTAREPEAAVAPAPGCATYRFDREHRLPQSNGASRDPLWRDSRLGLPPPCRALPPALGDKPEGEEHGAVAEPETRQTLHLTDFGHTPAPSPHRAPPLGPIASTRFRLGLHEPILPYSEQVAANMLNQPSPQYGSCTCRPRKPIALGNGLAAPVDARHRRRRRTGYGCSVRGHFGAGRPRWCRPALEQDRVRWLSSDPWECLLSI